MLKKAGVPYQEIPAEQLYDMVLPKSCIVASIPAGKSVFLLGRYSFDDYYLSFTFPSVKRGNKFFYLIGGREMSFLTAKNAKLM